MAEHGESYVRVAIQSGYDGNGQPCILPVDADTGRSTGRVVSCEARAEADGMMRAVIELWVDDAPPSVRQRLQQAAQGEGG